MIYAAPKHIGHETLERVVTHGRFNENAIRDYIGMVLGLNRRFHFSTATPQQCYSAMRYTDAIMRLDGRIYGRVPKFD